MQLLLIDNFDSFTHNLAHLLEMAHFQVQVIRRNDLDLRTLRARKPDAVCISPGPGTPTDSGFSRDAIGYCLDASIPLLGICLGMQALAEHFGASVIEGIKPVHGKSELMHHSQQGLFEGIETPVTIGRYHSLVVNKIQAPLLLDAQNTEGVAMAIRHENKPAYGLQFHPESFLTSHGLEMMSNFYRKAKMMTGEARHEYS